MRPTHREFKILLDGARFRERASLHAVARVLAHVARAQDVPLDRVPAIESRVRTVELFDTPDEHLRASHRILRRRRFHDHGWPGASWEVTYKVRSEDRSHATAADVRAAASLTAGPLTRLQLKEEILPGSPPGGSAVVSRSLWSHNLVLDTPALPLPADVGTVAGAVPDVGMLDVPHSTRLERVGHRHVVEVGALLGHLHLGQHTVAHADVALWRSAGDDEAFVAEAGFTYHVTGDPGEHVGADARADRFFLGLVTAFAAWRTDVPTKTQALYDLSAREARSPTAAAGAGA